MQTKQTFLRICKILLIAIDYKMILKNIAHHWLRRFQYLYIAGYIRIAFVLDR